MDMEGYDSEMSLIPTFKSRLRPGRRTPCLSSDEHGLMVARDVSSPPPSLSYSAAADHHIPPPLSSPIRHATVESSSPPPMTPFSLTKRGGFRDREERGWDPKLASNSQSTMDLRYYQRRDGVDVRSSSPSLPLRSESGGGRSLHIVKDRHLGPSSSTPTSNFSFSSSPPSFASYDKYEAYHLPRSYTERDGGGFSRGERVGQVYKHPYYQYHRQPDRPQRPITTFNIHPHRRHQSLHIPSSSQTLRHSRISGQQHITPTPDDDADADTADADANMDVFGESTTSSTYSFDFPASSSRLTFFRTSSERGHWKDDPMALHRRTPQLQSSPARPMKMTPSNSMSDSMLVPSMLDGRSKALSSPPSVPPSYTHTHTHSHSRKALSISSLCDSQPDLLLIPPSSSPTSSLVPGFTLSSSSPTSLSVSPPNSALSSSSSSGFPLRMDLRDPERDTPYSDVPHTLPSLSSDRASSLGVDVDLLDEEKDGGGGRDVASGGATGRRDALNHDDAEDDDEDDDDVLGLPSSPVRVHDVLRFKSPMQIGGTSSPTLLGVYGEERKTERHGRPLQHRQEQQGRGRQQQQRQKRSLKFREVSPLPPSSPILSPTDEERRDGCMSPVMRPVSPLSLDEDEDEVEMGDEHERLAEPADVDLDLDLALPASSPLSSAPSSPLAVAVDLPVLKPQSVMGLKETPSTRVRISSLLNHDDGGEVVMRQVQLSTTTVTATVVSTSSSMSTRPLKALLSEQETEKAASATHIPCPPSPSIASSHGEATALPPTDLDVEDDTPILQSTSTFMRHSRPSTPDQPQYLHHDLPSSSPLSSPASSPAPILPLVGVDDHDATSDLLPPASVLVPSTSVTELPLPPVRVPEDLGSVKPADDVDLDLGEEEEDGPLTDKERNGVLIKPKPSKSKVLTAKSEKSPGVGVKRKKTSVGDEKGVKKTKKAKSKVGDEDELVVVVDKEEEPTKVATKSLAFPAPTNASKKRKLEQSDDEVENEAHKLLSASVSKPKARSKSQLSSQPQTQQKKKRKVDKDREDREMEKPGVPPKTKMSKSSKSSSTAKTEEDTEMLEVASESKHKPHPKKMKTKSKREDKVEETPTLADKSTSVPQKPSKSKSKSKGTSSLSTSSSASSSTSKLTSTANASSTFNLELCGMIIESMASSRSSSLSISTIVKLVMQSRPTLKAQKDDKEWCNVFVDVMEEGNKRWGVFGKVESSGKDDSDKPLEARWFYAPELDPDQDRAMLVRSMMPRPAKRNVTKQYKQYYWQPVEKISRWDPEDAL